MGWFTYRSKSWEVKNALLLLGIVGGTSLLSLGVLTPLAIQIFGSVVSMTKWTKQSLYIAIFYFLFLFLALFILLANSQASYVIAFCFISFYVYTVYISFHIGEYLQRLDLKNYMELEKNVSYSYYQVYQQLNVGSLQASSQDSFIAGLNIYKKQIDDRLLLKDIEELERLCAIIVSNSNDSELFFARHSASILGILQQYIELNNSYLKNDQTNALVSNLKQVISNAKTAFENEITNMVERQVLQVDAESQVYVSLLKAKGLL
ncbi:hypothetical protein [Myroides sp. LJL119]